MFAEKAEKPYQFISTLHLIYTNRCPLTCEHCIANVSTKQQEKFVPEKAGQIIEQASKTGFSRIGFTGGEPLLYWKEIEGIIGTAKRMGMDTGIITSGAVTKKWEELQQIIKILSSSGLNRITVSWDDFHERQYLARGYDPRNIYKLIDFCKESNIKVCIKSILTGSEKNKEFQRLIVRDAKMRKVKLQSWPILLYGSAGSSSHYKPFTNHSISCGNAKELAIDWKGDTFLCCGPLDQINKGISPLYIGNINVESFETLVQKARTNIIARAISCVGYTFLIDLLDSELRSHFETGTFTSKCDLCLKLTNSPEIVLYLDKRLRVPEIKYQIMAAGLIQSKRTA